MADKHSFSTSTLVITIVVAIVLMAAIWPLSQLGKGSMPVGDTDEADVRIRPIARLELPKPAGAAKVSDGKPRDGVTIYNSVCVACHATGIAGSPKAGDKAAWAPRLAQGKPTLYNNALNGKNAMPPKGGAADLSETELKAAVDYLTGLAK
jgi:cytochrome c5